MFAGRLPDVPRLFYAIDLVDQGGIVTSATGLDECLSRARLRCASELRERVALQDWIGANECGAEASQGSACARCSDEALERAALEAIERMVAQDWWSGGLPARALYQNEEAVAGSFLARLRRKRPRETLIFGLPTVIGVHVIGAVSNVGGLRDMCIGVAARVNGADAVRAAIREMFQMEFGLEVIRYRTRNGIAASPRETVALDRAGSLNWQDCADLLTTSGAATDDGSASRKADGINDEDIIALLSRQGFDASHDVRAYDDGAFLAVVTIAHPKRRVPNIKPGVWTRWPLYL